MFGLCNRKLFEKEGLFACFPCFGASFYTSPLFYTNENMHMVCVFAFVPFFMFVNRFYPCRRMCGIGINQNARHLYMQNAKHKFTYPFYADTLHKYTINQGNHENRKLFTIIFSAGFYAPKFLTERIEVKLTWQKMILRLFP